jgi:hypothetical protein
MKKILISAGLSVLMASQMAFASEQSQSVANAQSSNEQTVHQRFREQHEKLIPIVAVADMFFACNRATKSDDYDHQIDDLVLKMNKNELADKLVSCLNGASLKSDIALNYGLVGCFHAQMKSLDQQQYNEKMAQLDQLLASLPREERQQTFTKCVTDQAIYYIK